MDEAALQVDPYAVAWKLKRKDRLIPEVVGHIHRQISLLSGIF